MGHTEKLMEGKQIIKARLFAKVFQEIQDFRTDSPCYSSIWSVLSVLTSNKWRIKSANVKTAFLQIKKFERGVCIPLPNKVTTAKSGDFRDVSMVWRTIVDIGIFELNKNFLGLVQLSVRLTQESSFGKKCVWRYPHRSFQPSSPRVCLEGAF